MPQSEVVHVSSVHTASDTRILVKECESLAESGFAVTLYARNPELASSERVTIRDIGIRAGRRLERAARGNLAVLRIGGRHRKALLHLHDPELIPAGLLLRLLRRRVVFDAHESLSAQVFSKPWVPGPLRGLVSVASGLLFRVADRGFSGIVTATPHIAQAFDNPHTVIVHNFPRIDELASIEIGDMADRSPHVAYIGGVTRVRGAIEMARLAASFPHVRFTVAGPVESEALMQEMQGIAGAGNLVMPGRVSRQDVRDILSRATVGLALLYPEPNHVDSYPVKLFEYMAAGVPVITSNFSLWEQFVQDHHAGIMVDPHDAGAVAEALHTLLGVPNEAAIMGRNGRRAVVGNYNWTEEASTLVELYARITSFDVGL